MRRLGRDGREAGCSRRFVCAVTAGKRGRGAVASGRLNWRTLYGKDSALTWARKALS